MSLLVPSSWRHSAKKQAQKRLYGMVELQAQIIGGIRIIREYISFLSCREELEQKGMIVSWCSQIEVLTHPSLGCFVSHCGWNSTLESLVSGVPVVAFPQWTDQGTNAKLIEDMWKIGIRVTVNEEGIVESDEFKRCLEIVMGESQGFCG
ncbi:unnamed protein product, partial [Vitis vinifera]